MSLSKFVVTKFPWNKTRDTPEFTGLPTDVFYMTQVEKLKMEMNELLKSFELMRSALVADIAGLSRKCVRRLPQSWI